MKANQEQNKPEQGVESAYERPQIEIIEMEAEGILCASAPTYTPGGGN